MKMVVSTSGRVVEQQRNETNIVELIAERQVQSLGLLYMTFRLLLPHLHTSPVCLLAPFETEP